MVQSTAEKTQSKEKARLPVLSTVQEDEMQVPVEGAEEKTDEKTGLDVPLESKGTETGDDLNDADMGTEPAVNLKEMDDSDAIAIEKDTGFKVETRGSGSNDEVRIVEEGDDKPDESIVIVIQAAVRGFLARRELWKQKRVVKLQAAVRGHLVRRHAIGSLRVVQAIIKMQTLVRAHHGRQSKEDSSCGSAVPEKEIGMSKTNTASASIEKLLQNKFACHLMESTPKTKSICIKCDPTKPSSSWNWLERWMSGSSAERASKPDLSNEELETEKSKNVAPLAASEANEINNPQVELYNTENANKSDMVETPVEVDSHVNHSPPSAGKELGSLPKEPESVDEQAKHFTKWKASNPSFVAAQSKFEELTSSSRSNKQANIAYKDITVGESKTDRNLSEGGVTGTAKDLHIVEDDAQGVSNQLAGHDSASEVSISSALEKADKKADNEGGGPKNEARLPEQESYGMEKAEGINIIVKDSTSLDSVEDLQEKVDHVKDEMGNFVATETLQNLETNTPDAKKKYPETEMGHQQVHVFSPEASSLRTIPESQATPASEASSFKAKKSKTDKSGSSQKRKASKKAESSPKLDSGGANKLEQQASKDRKSGKRRNSFEFDQEPRDSCSSVSSGLPRFMQPTESARAKVQEHNTPKSSPDVQERDTSVKKRHSLSGQKGKQGLLQGASGL